MSVQIEQMLEEKLQEITDDLLDLDLSKKKKKKKVDKPVEPVITVTSADNTDDTVDTDYTYHYLVSRVFALLKQNNPTLMDRKKLSIPPPQISRVSTKKVAWSNFRATQVLLQRQADHMMNFITAELNTDGSIDNNGRLILRGRYVGKHIETILKKYMTEYVVCHMCKNCQTTLQRDQITRLFFLHCDLCLSKRSVAPIRTNRSTE